MTLPPPSTWEIAQGQKALIVRSSRTFPWQLGRAELPRQFNSGPNVHIIAQTESK